MIYTDCELGPNLRLNLSEIVNSPNFIRYIYEKGDLVVIISFFLKDQKTNVIINCRGSYTEVFTESHNFYRVFVTITEGRRKGSCSAWTGYKSTLNILNGGILI